MKNLSIISIALLSLSLGCGPDTVSTTADGESPTGTSASDDSTGTPAESTGNETNPSVDSSTGAVDTGSATTIGPDPDVGILECDLFGQDCPEGEKCTIWANDGGSQPNATRCVPVADDAGAPGDPCTVEGTPASGFDDCELGSWCWNIDGKTLEGECIAFCLGDESNPTCEDPGTTCVLTAEGPPLCYRTCNPLAPECEPDEGCYPRNEDWLCTPIGLEAGYGEPCEFINGCAPGLICLGANLVAGCEEGASGCCTDPCPLDDPMCQGAAEGAVCQPWYEEPPEGYENLGVCVLPEP